MIAKREFSQNSNVLDDKNNEVHSWIQSDQDFSQEWIVFRIESLNWLTFGKIVNMILKDMILQWWI